VGFGQLARGWCCIHESVCPRGSTRRDVFARIIGIKRRCTLTSAVHPDHAAYKTSEVLAPISYIKTSQRLRMTQHGFSVPSAPSVENRSNAFPSIFQ